MNDQWYYGQNGQQKGPFSLDVMKQLASGGQIRREDLVWKDGMPDWVPAGGVADLFPPEAAYPDTQGSPTLGQPPVGSQKAGGPIGYQPMPPATEAALRSKATTAMVLGICSIVPGSCLCAFVGIGLGIGAIIMGNQAFAAPNPGAAKAGVICGIVGICLSALSFIAGIAMQFAR